MIRLLGMSFEQLRIIMIAVLSPVLAVVTPTGPFLLALILCFGFNIWCGMRSDGVSIINCRPFRWKKFQRAVLELLLYVIIIELIRTVMYQCGDESISIYAVKTLTYVFMYVYLQNAFKNLVSTYPRNKALWVIYHVIRLEFKRAMPSNVSEMMEQYDKHCKEEEKKNETDK